jgi:hypothetical protein
MGVYRAVGLAAAAACILPAAVAAQTSGLPLRNAGFRTGVEVGLDVGFGRLAGTAPAPDQTVRALGASLAAGVGPLGASVTVGRADRDPNPDRTTATAAVMARMFGGPLVPLSITWQGALTMPLGDPAPGGPPDAERPWRGSLGVGAALTIPIPVLAITSWLAPRLDYFGRQPVVGSRTKGALAAGVDLGLLNGVVIRMAYDSRIGWEPAGNGPSGFSIGVGYRLR